MKSSITAATPGTSSSPSLTKSPRSDADIGLMGYDQRVLVLLGRRTYLVRKEPVHRDAKDEYARNRRRLNVRILSGKCEAADGSCLEPAIQIPSQQVGGASDTAA